MNSPPYAPGTKVRFKHPNGSTGCILAPTQYNSHVYYVKWYYGKDYRGEPITALAAVAHPCVRVITEKEFEQVADGPAFGGA